jgi:putative FmdB family regulatory protein
MPLYEYRCESCGATFEVIQKFSDPSVGTCKSCGGKVRRLLSAPAIQFKGTGWYITDYARKGMTGGGETDKSSSATSDSAKADKPAAAADTKGATPAGPSTPTPPKS